MAVLRGGRRLGHGTTNSTAALRTSGLADGGQNRPNRPVQTAHRKWEIAQSLRLDYITGSILRKVGKTGESRYERQAKGKWLDSIDFIGEILQFSRNQCFGDRLLGRV
jgi:hypothetical protein